MNKQEKIENEAYEQVSNYINNITDLECKVNRYIDSDTKRIDFDIKIPKDFIHNHTFLVNDKLLVKRIIKDKLNHLNKYIKSFYIFKRIYLDTYYHYECKIYILNENVIEKIFSCLNSSKIKPRLIINEKYLKDYEYNIRNKLISINNIYDLLVSGNNMYVKHISENEKIIIFRFIGDIDRNLTIKSIKEFLDKLLINNVEPYIYKKYGVSIFDKEVLTIKLYYSKEN